MNRLLIYILLVFLNFALINIANAQDTLKTRKPIIKKTLKKDSLNKQQKNEIEKKFIDENMNGIDDRKEKQGKKKKRDEFIDLDGDGINDGQESGIGLKKALQYRKRKKGGGKKGH